MVELKISQPIDTGDFPVTYYYLIGHAFGTKADDYSVEPVGRFGTSTEASAHVDIINQDLKKEGEEGLLANKKEFPFLILETIRLVYVDTETKSVGKTRRFFIYDWAENQYIDIGNVSREESLNQYKERVDKFLEKREVNKNPSS